MINSLTPRELEVFKLVASGLCFKEIAGKLFISEKTVQKHVCAAYKKLGVHHTVQAAHLGLHHGLADNMYGTKKSWRCFHCDEVFESKDAAREHFGPTLVCDPICQIDAARFREMEKQLARYREDDTDLHRQIHTMESDYRAALRRAEEEGYAKGLRDGRMPQLCV